MLTRTCANWPLSCLLSILTFWGHFSRKFQSFHSLFSASLLSIQEASSNEIKDLRGAGSQVDIGGLERQRMENDESLLTLSVFARLTPTDPPAQS